MSAAVFFLGGCVYRSTFSETASPDDFRPPNTYHAAQRAGKSARSRLAGSAKPAIAKKSAPSEKWWRAFEDVTLNRLVGHAFSANLDLEVTRTRIVQSQAQLRAAGAGFYPSITGSGEAGRSQTVLNLPGAVLNSGSSATPASSSANDSVAVELQQNRFRLSLAASYELDLWGQVRHGKKSARHRYRASEEDLRSAYVTVAASVADAYYLLVERRAQLELAKETAAGRRSLLAFVAERYRVGIASPADLYQAKERLAQIEAQQFNVEAATRLAENALALIVGAYPGQVDSGALLQVPDRVLAFKPGAPAQLLLQRPDLRAGYQRLLAVDQDVGAALAAHFPQIVLSPSIGKQFSPTGVFWNLVGGLTAPLFQGGKINARYREKKALLREAIAAFKRSLIVAVKEVEDALVLSEFLAKQLSSMRARVSAAEHAFQLSLDLYKEGLSTYLQVLSAEENVFNARRDEISVKRERIAAHVSLTRALGGRSIIARSK